MSKDKLLSRNVDVPVARTIKLGNHMEIVYLMME